MSGRSFLARGGVWLSAASVSLCVLLMLGLIAVLLGNGFAAFWPRPVELLRWQDGTGTHQLLAQVLDRQDDALVVRGSEVQRSGEAYRRIPLRTLLERSAPSDAVELELRDERLVFARGNMASLSDDLAGNRDLVLRIDDASSPLILPAAGVYRVRAPNGLSYWQHLGECMGQVWRFLSTGPTAANPGGGVLPALIGTVMLVLLMSVLVMPLGVLAAVYLHDQAPGSRRTRLLRSAVNNLAGVPAIIYGLIGLALFVHQIGGSIDQLFYATRLPTPTFGSGGLLWAALTLALLTLPVVIVTTEEGLTRVPQTLRDGALALGATRAETLWYLLLPLARPALLTGLILAIARAAGEVAPLMLVGVVKLAPAGIVDSQFPYLHPAREFMHLGYQIYDSALQGSDAWRAEPRAYACAVVLLMIVLALNLGAILLRNRLRARYRTLSY